MNIKMDAAAILTNLDDPRWRALHLGLGQLKDRQLLRIIRHVANGGRMVCDTFNYDPNTDAWCPLAVGLGVPGAAAAALDQERFTNESAKAFIVKIGRHTSPTFTLNPVSGIPGTFFRDDRINDVISLCRYILAERSFERRKAA
jgi:hypothetical protein